MFQIELSFFADICVLLIRMRNAAVFWLEAKEARAKCRPFFGCFKKCTHLIFLTRKKTFLLKRNKVVRSANISHRIAPSSKCVNYSKCECVERRRRACSIRTFFSDKYFFHPKNQRNKLHV